MCGIRGERHVETGVRVRWMYLEHVNGAESQGRSAVGVGTLEEFFFSSRRRHTRFDCDWSSDVCSSDLAIAVVGLAVNLGCAWLLHAHAATSLNVRGAYLHALGDALSSVGVVVAALVVEIGRASCRERV